MTASLKDDKRSVHDGLARIATAPAADTHALMRDVMTRDAVAHFSHPFNDHTGTEQIDAAFWQPLKQAFPDIERTETINVAGDYEGSRFVACLGHYTGTFVRDWVTIPASHKVTWLRFGEIHRLEDGLIVETWCIIDMLDVMRQAGVWPLPQSLGAEGLWPAPGSQNGLRLDTTDPEGGAESMRLVRTMHEALFRFDGRTLTSMEHGHLWTPNFSWYGPSGIGTARGLSGFEAHHQIPFLTAFPDRRGGQHITRLGDGPFVVTGGWPSVTATHTGDGWLGLPATGRPVGMRVMDFYRCEDGLIAENWVPIDITHVLKQIGYDIFARLDHLRGNPRRTLS